MKNHISIPAIAIIVLMSCNNAKNTAATGAAVNSTTMKTDSVATDGWITLFDGSNITGWHSYGKDKASDRWKITEGTLSIDTSNKAG